MSDKPTAIHDVDRYRPVGLIANPFVASQSSGDTAGTMMEILSEADRLLVAIDDAVRTDAPKPIRVDKTVDFPEYYPSRSVAEVEHALIHDESLNVLHAYVPFFTMRLGRVRATLLALSERLAFRDFDRTLACFLERVLETPDESLASFARVNPTTFTDFAKELSSDQAAAVASLFGPPVEERRPEMASTADTRLNRLPADVDEAEDTAELDDTVGEAPTAPTVFDAETLQEAAERGVAPAEVEVPTEGETGQSDLLRDYFIDYARVHLSPVIARAFKTYRERGIDAMSYELRITKAPRKTLRAIAQLAVMRFRKLVVMYDGFETWGTVPADLKSNIVGSLTEIRWALDGYAVVVMMLDRGIAPELSEQFAGGTILSWDFANLPSLGGAEPELRREFIEGWLDAAKPAGAPEISADVVEQLYAASAGDPVALAAIGYAAVEDAANRGVLLDAASVANALAAAD